MYTESIRANLALIQARSHAAGLRLSSLSAGNENYPSELEAIFARGSGSKDQGQHDSRVTVC